MSDPINNRPKRKRVSFLKEGRVCVARKGGVGKMSTKGLILFEDLVEVKDVDKKHFAKGSFRWGDS